MVRLNIGCGTDYRDGFVNIDGSNTLKSVDKVIKIPEESLQSHFEEGSIDYILCNDFIEHHFHFEALKILNEFYLILKLNGTISIRVPDCEKIIKRPFDSIERKLTLLFGGQDIPQGNPEMDASRKEYPQFFCHKYGWTKSRMKNDLEKIGFKKIKIMNSKNNIVIEASK